MRARAAADKGTAAILNARASLIRAQTEAHQARAPPAAPDAAPAPAPAPVSGPTAAPAQQDMATILALLQQVTSAYALFRTTP